MKHGGNASKTTYTCKFGDASTTMKTRNSVILNPMIPIPKKIKIKYQRH